METYLSKHAHKRIKERCSVSNRQTILALERGREYNEFAGSFRRYLDKVRLKEPFYTEIKIFNNCIFLFDDKINLITVLKVPSKYLKLLK